MTDPPRWLDEDGDAPPEARELLQHARRTRGVDRATLIATAAAVAELGARPAIAVALAKLAALPHAAAALPAAAKIVTTVAVMSAVAIVSVPSTHEPSPRARRAHTHQVSSPEPSVQRTTSKTAAVEAPIAQPTVTPMVQVIEPLAAAPVAATPEPPRASPRLRAPRARALPVSPSDEPALPPVAPEPADPLAAEVSALDAARTALGSTPARALRRADEHATRFPTATLAAERELIAIDALMRLGQRAQALARAARLRAGRSGGLYESRLKALLE
jgi:hypothetical protein